MIKHKKLLLTSGILIIAILFIWLTVFYKNAVDTVAEMHIPIVRDISDKRVEEVFFQEQVPFSVLVLGIDEREGDTGRSDTIIVMVINQTEKSTKIVSIPRDTYTEMVGRNTKDKINHAYAFGGADMAVASIENLLDIPIDYIATINMEGFESIVDAVGGIAVMNDLAFEENDFVFPEGKIQLDGKAALSFVRMRYEDPRGDFGRQDRQKKIIEGVLRKGASLSGILNYKSVFNALGTNVRTNMTFDDMMDVQKNYRSALGKVEQLHFQEGAGQMIGGIWYYMMDTEELAEVTGELKVHLGMK